MRNKVPSEVTEEKAHRIRDIVVDWYEKNRLRTETECYHYDLSKKEGRVKIFILGIFYNCIPSNEHQETVFHGSTF